MVSEMYRGNADPFLDPVERMKFHEYVHQLEAEAAHLRAEVERLTRERADEARSNVDFPIQNGPAIPWTVVAPYEQQALKNHEQTLEELARRGGLCVSEAIDLLLNQRWNTTKEQDVPRLRALVAERTGVAARLAAQLAGALRGVALGKITSGQERDTWCWCEQPGIKLVGCHELRCAAARDALAAAEQAGLR